MEEYMGKVSPDFELDLEGPVMYDGGKSGLQMEENLMSPLWESIRLKKSNEYVDRYSKVDFLSWKEDGTIEKGVQLKQGGSGEVMRTLLELDNKFGGLYDKIKIGYDYTRSKEGTFFLCLGQYQGEFLDMKTEKEKGKYHLEFYKVNSSFLYKMRTVLGIPHPSKNPSNMKVGGNI